MAVRDVVQAAAGVGGGGEYVEDVFSTYLYEGLGNGGNVTVSNGVNLSEEGGLVWAKQRSGNGAHALVDTVRGANQVLLSYDTSAEFTQSSISAFSTTGFTVANGSALVNAAFQDYASWSFRKSPNFFDVVTWTGDGVDGREISHNLGSVPGMVIVKCTNDATRWATWHRSLTAGHMVVLETTGAEILISGSSGGGVSSADASTFTVNTGTSLNWVNGSTKTYVAYLFAHDAGGFGDDGEQNVISCGSYTGTGVADNAVNIGWEPQWLLWKPATSTGDWQIVDAMRGFTASGVGVNRLEPNTSDAEALTGIPYCDISSTGFVQSGSSGTNNASGQTYIYIAIRRPMKTPESGTEVFAIDQGDGVSTSPQYISSFPVDMAINKYILEGGNSLLCSRLTQGKYLKANDTSAEVSNGSIVFDFMNGWRDVITSTNWYSWMFRRAPSVFDVVCYTGTGVAGRTVNHNLGVAPEMMIVKKRNNARDWKVYHSASGNGKASELNATGVPVDSPAFWNDTTPTNSVFSVGSSDTVNGSGDTFIAYLFASLPGVSKCGSYSGTGADLNVDCGFSAGARFILIKRTDSTGDWYVWDSARGIVSGNDPYLLLNSTAAEVTSTDYIDPLASGFTVTSSAPAALNASGGSFIFLAIS